MIITIIIFFLLFLLLLARCFSCILPVYLRVPYGFNNISIIYQKNHHYYNLNTQGQLSACCWKRKKGKEGSSSATVGMFFLYIYWVMAVACYSRYASKDCNRVLVNSFLFAPLLFLVFIFDHTVFKQNCGVKLKLFISIILLVLYFRYVNDNYIYQANLICNSFCVSEYIVPEKVW
jgi:hypothetical protein